MTGSFPAADHPSCLAFARSDILTNTHLGVTPFWDRTRIQKPSLLSYLESFQYYIPGTSTLATTISPSAQPPSGLIPSYIALILLSAAASALGCFLLARRYAFSRAHRIGWALCGFFFGWVGFVLMLVLQEWPTRVVCPICRTLRVVTCDTCEHCGALHAAPVVDGTEIFEAAAAAPIVALTTV
jgi:hypothetical protein